MSDSYLFTSESVGEGHPDKAAVLAADARARNRATA
jgi:S-adenosylmethionine synthetase